jgi:hypothetical protein
MLNREVLEMIAKSSSSTELERAEALAAIGRMDQGKTTDAGPQSQQDQDDELLTWLTPKRDEPISERIAARSRLSPSSRRLLDDFTDALLAGEPAHGAEERMTALFARTGSEVIKHEAQRALGHIAYFRAHEKALRAKTVAYLATPVAESDREALVAYFADRKDDDERSVPRK